MFLRRLLGEHGLNIAGHTKVYLEVHVIKYGEEGDMVVRSGLWSLLFTVPAAARTKVLNLMIRLQEDVK